MNERSSEPLVVNQCRQSPPFGEAHKSTVTPNHMGGSGTLARGEEVMQISSTPISGRPTLGSLRETLATLKLRAVPLVGPLVARIKPQDTHDPDTTGDWRVQPPRRVSAVDPELPGLPAFDCEIEAHPQATQEPGSFNPYRPSQSRGRIHTPGFHVTRMVGFLVRQAMRLKQPSSSKPSPARLSFCTVIAAVALAACGGGEIGEEGKAASSDRRATALSLSMGVPAVTNACVNTTQVTPGYSYDPGEIRVTNSPSRVDRKSSNEAASMKPPGTGEKSPTTGMASPAGMAVAGVVWKKETIEFNMPGKLTCTCGATNYQEFSISHAITAGVNFNLINETIEGQLSTSLAGSANFGLTCNLEGHGNRVQVKKSHIKITYEWRDVLHPATVITIPAPVWGDPFEIEIWPAWTERIYRNFDFDSSEKIISDEGTCSDCK